MILRDQPELWLTGPVHGIIPMLQPVAHALLQAEREVLHKLASFPSRSLWEKPMGMASVGFHLEHLSGVADRLFTYAKNSQLDAGQLAFLQNEGIAKHLQTSDLLLSFSNQVKKSLIDLKSFEAAELLSPRAVGRKMIPSTVLGLLFHAAEHTSRHLGQVLVTAGILGDTQI